MFAALFVSAVCGSCSRYHQAVYHGPNKVSTKPHKEWKKPKSRYKKANVDKGIWYAARGVR